MNVTVTSRELFGDVDTSREIVVYLGGEPRLGKALVIDEYETDKPRVCVVVQAGERQFFVEASRDGSAVFGFGEGGGYDVVATYEAVETPVSVELRPSDKYDECGACGTTVGTFRIFGNGEDTWSDFCRPCIAAIAAAAEREAA
jgi:hypothetical protein